MRELRVPGFTLLELLAALAVLAVLASLSFRGLSSVLDGEAHVREEARRWSEVGLLFGQLREDISSAMEAPGLALGSSAEAQLVLTRFADEPVAPPRRVGYRLREGRVEYLLWAPGRDAGAPPAAAYPVLANVAEKRAEALATEAERAGFCVRGDDPLTRVVACSGAPACSSAHGDTRTLARELAVLAAPQAVGRTGLHPRLPGAVGPTQARIRRAGLCSGSLRRTRGQSARQVRGAGAQAA